jgi:hypothetical protein
MINHSLTHSTRLSLSNSEILTRICALFVDLLRLAHAMLSLIVGRLGNQKVWVKLFQRIYILDNRSKRWIFKEFCQLDLLIIFLLVYISWPVLVCGRLDVWTCDKLLFHTACQVRDAFIFAVTNIEIGSWLSFLGQDGWLWRLRA